MTPLMEYVDVCIGNEEDAQYCLGFKPDADVEAGNTSADGYYSIFKQMKEKFNFEYVVSTLRESYSASHNGWKALIYDGKEYRVGILIGNTNGYVACVDKDKKVRRIYIDTLVEKVGD